MAFLTDFSANNLTVTSIGNVSPSTSVKKFGTASAYFDGDGDFLSVNSDGFAPGTGAMTIEMWVNFASLPDNGSISGFCGTLQEPGYAGNNSWWLGLLNQGGTTYLNLGRHGDGQIYAKTEWSPNANTWYYVAAVKQESGNIRLFVDGVSLSVTQSSSSGWADNNFSQTNFCIGVIATPAYFNGYIDDLRVTKGIARYTSNFTPPTAPFPNISLLSIPGLSLWLKADAGVTTSGSSVTAWSDQSGNGNDATGDLGGGTAPVLAANSLNGKPGIQFNGNQILLTNNFYPVNYNTPITMIGVAKASASTVKGSQYAARWFETASNQGAFDTGLVFGPYNGTPAFGSLVGVSYQGENNVLNSSMGENEKGLAILVNNGVNSKYYHNGALKGTYNFGWTGGDSTDGGFAIGATYIPNLPVIDFKSTSTIYELAIYNRAITSQERQQVEAYLNSKYSIY